MEPYVIPKRAAGHVTVHIWRWIDGAGNGALHRIFGRHTSASYCGMLEDVSKRSQNKAFQVLPISRIAISH